MSLCMMCSSGVILTGVPLRKLIQSILSYVQDFREPLYLTDKPLQLPDTRTEEEMRYPELFRHRLRIAPVC